VIIIVYVPTFVLEVVYQLTTLVLGLNVINDVEALEFPGVTAIE
jgi:hypothetical protein